MFMAVGLGLMSLRQKLHASIRRSTHSSLLHVDDAKDAGSSNGSMIVQRLFTGIRLCRTACKVCLELL